MTFIGDLFILARLASHLALPLLRLVLAPMDFGFALLYCAMAFNREFSLHHTKSFTLFCFPFVLLGFAKPPSFSCLDKQV